MLVPKSGAAASSLSSSSSLSEIAKFLQRFEQELELGA
jgi:hypothetical protein